MHTTADLERIARRVLGLSLPHVPVYVRAPRWIDNVAAVTLLLSSAIASMLGLWLWSAGLGDWALRLLGAVVVVMAVALRIL